MEDCTIAHPSTSSQTKQHTWPIDLQTIPFTQKIIYFALPMLPIWFIGEKRRIKLEKIIGSCGHK